jgi:hypothetical protein
MNVTFWIGLTIIAFFGFLTFRDWPTIRIAWQSRRWLPAPATVMDMKDHSFVIDSVNKYSAATTTKYVESEFMFRYTVNEVSHTSNCYSFGGHVDQLDAPFAVGNVTTIYYDPHDPSRAVVKRGLSISILSAPLLTILGVAWLLAFAL